MMEKQSKDDTNPARGRRNFYIDGYVILASPPRPNRVTEDSQYFSKEEDDTPLARLATENAFSTKSNVPLVGVRHNRRLSYTTYYHPHSIRILIR